MKKILKRMMFLFVILIGGVALAACSNGADDAMAKEEDAIMFQAMSAAALNQKSGLTVEADPNLKVEVPGLDVDVDVEVDFDAASIKAEIEERAKALLNEFSAELLRVRELIVDLDFDHKKSEIEGYTNLTVFESVDLNGKTFKYEFHYNQLVEGQIVEEDDDELEYEFKGLLIYTYDGEEIFREEVSGEVEIEEGETVTKLVHETTLGKIEIESKIEKGIRVFEYNVEIQGFETEFELSVEELDEGVQLNVEIEVEIEAGIKSDFELSIKALKNDSIEVEIEYEYEMTGLDIDVELDLILTKLSETQAEAQVVGKLDIEGKLGEQEINKETDVDFKLEIDLTQEVEEEPVEDTTETEE